MKEKGVCQIPINDTDNAVLITYRCAVTLSIGHGNNNYSHKCSLTVVEIVNVVVFFNINPIDTVILRYIHQLSFSVQHYFSWKCWEN